MLLCETCGSLKKKVRTAGGVEHRCPECEAGPGRAPAGPTGAGSTGGFQRADQLRTDRSSAASSSSPSSSSAGASASSAANGSSGPASATVRTGDPPEGAGRFFPFPSMRPGQAQFIQDVRRVLKEREILVAQVPTGVGKTAGVLAPALEVAARSSSKVFFLTSKQSQHKVVVDTLRLAEQVSGTDIVVSDMISKKAMCPRSESETLGARAFGEFCTKAMAKGSCSYYEEDEQDVIHQLGNEIHHVEQAVQLSEREHVCPFKALTEVARVADVVVLDYNHFFSDLLNATLDRFQTSLDDAILVIDEAHNLPDRIRSHLTWRLTSRLLTEASDEARKKGAHPAARFLNKLAEHVESYEGNDEQELEPETLLEHIDRVLEATFRLAQPDLHELIDELDDVAQAVLKEESVSACEEVVEFLERWSPNRRLREEKVLRFWDPDAGAITYQILDAATLARPIFEDIRGAVLMSGTLYPMKMYGSILGVPRDRGVYERYPNPFPEENRCMVIDQTVSSKMTERGPGTYKRIAGTISEVCDATPGNVAAFFPSYRFMEDVADRLPRTDRDVLVEQRSHDKGDRENLVARLRATQREALLMGVQGGSLSEGYDFVADGDNLLKSVLVIGVPYAPPTTQVKSLQAFYDDAFGDGKGWTYGYLAPAIQRTLQAAGRAVRAADHRAFIALMDRRFQQRQIQRWLPPDMNPRPVQEVAEACRRFFG